jgi:hypothetical protein
MHVISITPQIIGRAKLQQSHGADNIHIATSLTLECDILLTQNIKDFRNIANAKTLNDIY